MIKVGLVSLGCAKNLVDSEMMLAMFPSSFFSIVSDPSKADLIIINTCAFISDAKKESIDTIIEMAKYKAKIAVTGCLAERYEEELKKELKEADIIVPIHEYGGLHGYLSSLLQKEVNPLDPLKRVISTPSFAAYLRISEGCDNMCAYCAIPLIRGRFHSRPYDEIIKEAKILLSKGYKELTLISQDTANYGKDFKGRKPNLLDLLKGLDECHIPSIRLLYLYPDELNTDLIDYIAKSKSIEHYFDIPIQSGSDHVLKLMCRHDKVETTRSIISYIREKCPDAIIRTTLIAGFPGENEADHQETLSLLKELRFDHLGCFAYSKEEGTRAYSYPNQVHPSTKKRRVREILSLQQAISLEANKKRIGTRMKGYVLSKEGKYYYLRSSFNAPDDIDGKVIFVSEQPLQVGDEVTITIDRVSEYDLFGHL